MTVWIQKQDNEFADDYIFAAYLGFRYLGHVIGFYRNPRKIHYKKGDIVVGSLESVNYIMDKLGIELPNFYIPNELIKYAGRTIYQSTIGDITSRTDKTPIFIKPIKTKEFPAQVFTSLPLITFIGQDPDSGVPDKIAELPMCSFSRHYATSNLNHDVFTLFF